MVDHPISVQEIASRLRGDLVGPGDLSVSGINFIETARPGEITFIGDQKHAGLWPRSRATAAIVTRGISVPEHDPKRRALVVTDDADLSVIELMSVFLPEKPRPAPGHSRDAPIHASARIDPSAVIEPGVRIGAGAVVGPRCWLRANVIIEEDVTLGTDCVIGYNTVIHSGSRIGNRVEIYSGCVIGADGFGFRPDGKGGIVKLPHIGNVEIGDDVEIGACCTIDRAKFGSTVIGPHTKLDNQVHIGHNVVIGRGCVLAAQTGIAGTSVIGDFCRFAGQSGVRDHVRMGDKVQVAGNSSVFRDVESGQSIGGVPAINTREFWRLFALWRRLPEIFAKVESLEASTLRDRGGHGGT